MSNQFSSYNFCQAEWGPLRHVRVIKERNSGASRGFAFIDFPDMVPIFKTSRLTSLCEFFFYQAYV